MVESLLASTASIDPADFTLGNPGHEGGGGGGFDPGVPIFDQIKKNGSGNDDDDGDNTDPSPFRDANEFGGAAANPDIVNPAPILKGFTLMGPPSSRMGNLGAATNLGSGAFGGSTLFKPNAALRPGGNFQRANLGIVCCRARPRKCDP